MEILALQSRLGGARHRAQLSPIEPLARDLVRHDQVRLCIDSALDVGANEAAVPGDLVLPHLARFLSVDPPGQPHKFYITLRFALKPSTGRDAVQIAVDEKLQQHRGVTARAAGPGRSASDETERGHIKVVCKEIHHPNQVILLNPVLEPVWKKRRLLSVDAVYETSHPDPQMRQKSIAGKAVSTQPRHMSYIGHGGYGVACTERILARWSWPISPQVLLVRQRRPPAEIYAAFFHVSGVI